MPTNNFKLFDENKANMMADVDYAVNQQRLSGVQSGIASSQLQNKTLYQVSLMCYALAQIMAANGYDANDANAVSTFVNNLSLTTLQKVVDKASATDIKNKAANKWVPASLFGQNLDTIGETYLKLAGGTMLGNLILNSDPTLNLQAATKQYVDKCGKVAVGSYTGNGKVTEGEFLSLTFPFPPKMLIIFSSYNISLSALSSLTSERYLGFSNFDTQSSGASKSPTEYPFSIWFAGMTKAQIYVEKTPNTPLKSSAVNFTLSGNSLNMSLSVAYGTQTDKYGAPEARFIYNVENEIYPYAVFG